MYVIGIAGGSGSGKSTFSERIKEAFPESVVVLRSDNYYFGQDSIPMEERAKRNYDTPESIDFPLMIEQVKQLKAGKTIQCPVYDFAKHTRSKTVQTIEPRPIVILDGILILGNEELRDLIDLKIFVEADADERVLRRMRRDVVERGRTIDSVITQYLSTVKPMHYLFVEPSKSHADIVINGGFNKKALDLITTKISSLMQQQ